MSSTEKFLVYITLLCFRDEYKTEQTLYNELQPLIQIRVRVPAGL